MLALPVLILLVGSGCSGGGSAPTAPSPGGVTGANVSKVAITAGGQKQAQRIFEKRCSTCHGPEGRGNGPGAAGLNPKPRNYHDKVWQAQVTDDEIEKAIMYGGAAVGKSPAMAANPDLVSKPEVVAALREYIRKLGKQD
jgi:mono/diheme cytochrome c family protein